MVELGVLVCNHLLPGGSSSSCSQGGVCMCALVCVCASMCVLVFFAVDGETESRVF